MRSVSKRPLAVDVLSALTVTLLVRWTWSMDDALFATAMVLPWASLLVALSIRRMGRDLARPVSVGTAPLFGLSLWLAFGPWRSQVGWAAIDALWIAAVLAMMALVLWRLMPALRRLLDGRHRAESVSAVFFALPLALYLVIQPWSLDQRQPDGDEPYYLLLAHSLAYDGDIDLANNYAAEHWRGFMGRAIERQPGDPRGDSGELYSRHNALLPLMLAPAYGLAGRAGATAMIGLMSACLVWLLVVTARRLWPKSATGALITWLIVAFTPPMLLYSHQIWIEVPAALLTLWAFDRLLRLRQERTSRRFWIMAQLLVALVLLPLLKMRLLLVVVPLALAALMIGSHGVGPERRRAWWALGGILTLALLALLGWNEYRYDNPFKMYRMSEFELFTSPVDIWLRGLVGMFYDCSFGLFAVAPVWLLLLPALAELVRRRDSYLWLLVGVATPYMLALAPRMEWYGGWSPPFRYPLVFLPLLALALVPLLERRSAGTRYALTLLGAITALLTALWITTPGWTYNLADGASQLLHHVGVQLRADVARFFPSTIRPRPATWIWLASSLLLVPLAFTDGPRWRRRAVPVALGTLIAISVVVPVAAHHVPTRVVELEDAWMRKSRGRLHPELWTPLRPSHAGGWRMTTHSRVEIPVVAGGPRATIRVVLRRDTIGPDLIEFAAGDVSLGHVRMLRVGDWRAFEIGPVDWPAGEPLVLFAPKSVKRQDLGLLVDRLEIEWLDP